MAAGFLAVVFGGVLMGLPVAVPGQQSRLLVGGGGAHVGAFGLPVPIGGGTMGASGPVEGLLRPLTGLRNRL